MMALRIVVGFALGAAFGSFLNVVVYRVPRNLSVVQPRSGCPHCGAAIRTWQNVPVLSYVVLRGRCASCRARISVRYPLVELATAMLWLGAVVRFEELEEAGFVALAGTVLLGLAVIDLEHGRLPNSIVLPSTVAAVLWVGGVSVARSDTSILWSALGAGLAAFTLLLILALLSGGMGFGDVKLAAFIGVVTGRFDWAVSVSAIFAAFFIGGLVAIVLLIARKASRKQKVPFGPALASGALVALFAGPGPVQAWLGL